MKKVMVFGTFDIFHEGHNNFLRQAKKYGDRLIVVIARDKTVLKIKGRLTKNDEKKRLLAIKQSKLADRVILGNLKNKYQVILKNKPDIICLGYDQTSFINNLKETLNKSGLKKIEIKRLKPYKPSVYKSSKL